ncbi:unnamed protein product [Rhodiola kirilowii]
MLGEYFRWEAGFCNQVRASCPQQLYLLILDRINWKTNILTGLLIPYIFFSLPSLVFNIFRSLSNQEISNGVG